MMSVRLKYQNDQSNKDRAICVQQTPPKAQKNLNPNPVNTHSILDQLIEKEMRSCANQILVSFEELQEWIGMHIDVPPKTVLALLRQAQQYLLDPLTGEIQLTRQETGSWQTYIGIDGWIKLINAHPHFSGISFAQSQELVQGIPSWMECAIYRTDRTIPTTVREYLLEVQNASEVWQKIPRRMLRHKALQQCARLSLSIHPIEAQEKDGSTRATQEEKGNDVANLHFKSSNVNKIKGVVGLKTFLNQTHHAIKSDGLYEE